MSRTRQPTYQSAVGDTFHYKATATRATEDMFPSQSVVAPPGAAKELRVATPRSATIPRLAVAGVFSGGALKVHGARRPESAALVENSCLPVSEADTQSAGRRSVGYARRHRDGDQRRIGLTGGIDMSHHIRSSGTSSVITASGATPDPITARSSRSRMRAAVSAGTSS
jgi:hypothetical protein